MQGEQYMQLAPAVVMLSVISVMITAIKTGQQMIRDVKKTKNPCMKALAVENVNSAFYSGGKAIYG